MKLTREEIAKIIERSSKEPGINDMIALSQLSAGGKPTMNDWRHFREMVWMRDYYHNYRYIKVRRP